MTPAIQRKPPARRAFSGLVGLPPEPAPVAEVPATAVKAKRWREQQKKLDPDFNRKQAERRKRQRDDTKRQEDLNRVLKSGDFPVEVGALRNKNGPPLSVTHGPNISVVGNAKTLADMRAQSISEHGGLDPISGVSLAKATTPEGAGPDVDEAVSSPEPREVYTYMPPREVRAMRNFIRGQVRTKNDGEGVMICLRCDKEIAPSFEFESGFVHLHDEHPELFEQMIGRVKLALQSKKKCSEQDHAALIQQHGHGTRRVQCKRCRKVIWKPPKFGSDILHTAAKAA